MGNGQVKSPNYMLCMDINFLVKNEKLRVLNPERMTLNPKSVTNQMEGPRYIILLLLASVFS